MWNAVAVLTCARSSRIASSRPASSLPQVKSVIALLLSYAIPLPRPSAACRPHPPCIGGPAASAEAGEPDETLGSVSCLADAVPVVSGRRTQRAPTACARGWAMKALLSLVTLAALGFLLAG